MTNASEAIELSVLEVALLNLVAIKYDPSNAVWNVCATLELSIYRSIHILYLFELNAFVLEIIVLAQV